MKVQCTPWLVAAFLFAPFGQVQAQFTFTTNNGTITITGYNGPGGAVTIPNTTNDLPVTRIGDYAFSSFTSLTSITIPNSVTSIGQGAFTSCTSLTSVTLPNSVTNIGAVAFAACTSLTGITLPNSVTSIGQAAFTSCTSLTSITLPISVTSVALYTFSSCHNLTRVTIPNSVASIGLYAFASCRSLTNVMIPNSVTNIGLLAFASCQSLSAISVDSFNSFYSSLDGVLFNKNQTLLIQCPGGKAGSYTIPNGVTQIGLYAFSSSTSLTSVTIPNSVTSIDSFAFSYSISLSGVYFKGNAPLLGADVFLGATNATVYYLPGTTGWGTTFGPRAVLWNPLVETGEASFGVRDNGFGFTVTGTSNLVIVMEASTSLDNPAWISVRTNTLIGGSSYFSDPEWTNHSGRFYRLRSP